MPNDLKSPLPRPEVATSFAVGFIVLCLVVYVLQAASMIMIPFVIAVCLWYLINALARGIGRVRLSGVSLPRFLCFVLAIFVLALGGWFIYKLISANALQVLAAAPEYQRRFEAFLPTLLEKIPEDLRPENKNMFAYLNLAAVMTALVRTFTGIAGQALVVLFYTGFLLYEQRFFRRKLREMITSPETEGRVERILSNIDVQVQRYIGVKTAVSALTGALTWLVLRYFHVDFAQFWGVMAFILNFIPYVGSLAAILLPTFVATVQYGDVSVIFMVLLSLSLVQMVCGSVLEPRLLGDSLNLSPIFIIFSVAAWGMIWGVPGMFLSIPILSMVVIVLSQFPSTQPLAIMLTKTGDIDRRPLPREDVPSAKD